MSDYTTADVKEADRLWDEYPLPTVSDITGIPEGTLKYWSQKDLITTETDHRGPDSQISEETADRIDGLWDIMPLTEIGDLLDIPYTTLKNLAQRGRISTDTEHRGQHQVKGMDRKIRRAARLAEKCDTNREAAARMNVAESTFYRYLKLYRSTG